MSLGEHRWSTDDRATLWGVFDVELTNRCNASCSFCPRDLTPGQGVMTQEVFSRTLEAAVAALAQCR